MPKYRNLTFVAPERRFEVNLRIDVIERFIEKPGRKAAEAAAASLGIRVAQFYNLVRAWRALGRPDAIAGAGAPRNRKSGMTPDQLKLIDYVMSQCGRKPARDIVAAIMHKARLDDVDMPPLGSVIRHIKRTRPSLLTDNVKDQFDLIIDHTVIDLNVDFGDGRPCRPLATMVIDVATDSIAGIALSPNLPAAAPTALAILDALQRRARKRRSSTTDLPRVGLVAMSLDEVGPLLSMLRKNGVDAQFLKTGAHGGGQHIEALLGSMHARLRLLPRLVWKVGIRGLARKANGVVPIGIDDALELVRSRIIDPQGVLLPGWFDDASKAHLTHGLIAIAQRAGDDS